MTKKLSSTTGSKIKSAAASSGQAVRRMAGAAKSAGKKATMMVSDLNNDGQLDREDAKIAGGKARRAASKVAEGAGKLAKAAAKHDMVKDAAAGAAIGAAVGVPVPVIGPAAGAAVGAIVGVAKNMRSAGAPPSSATPKQPKSSAIKSAMKRLRKPSQSADTPAAKPPKT